VTEPDSHAGGRRGAIADVPASPMQRPGSSALDGGNRSPLAEVTASLLGLSVVRRESLWGAASSVHFSDHRLLCICLFTFRINLDMIN
jgi:hypothetical protein